MKSHFGLMMINMGSFFASGTLFPLHPRFIFRAGHCLLGPFRPRRPLDDPYMLLSALPSVEARLGRLTPCALLK